MVRFAAVGLSYPSLGGRLRQDAIRNLSFTLGEGSFTWLLGPSGAGKTSVLRMMYAAMRPTRGEVEVLGVNLSDARRGSLYGLRRRIGVVHQEFRLLRHMTAYDNVALPLRLAGRGEASLRADVLEILDWVGLIDRQDRLPQELSGGEQQRMAIARAVVGRPALLIADEPTSDLDSNQARRLIALLTEMNRLGATVVVATHSEELPERYPARILTLEDGRLVADG